MRFFIVIIAVMAVAVWYFGFYGPNAFFKDYSGQSGYFVGRKLCTVPENPYQSGTDSYAGFQSAQQNRLSSCDVLLARYAAGCQEYLKEYAAYQKCESQ